ncbi:hypothetical protein ACQ5RZ_06695 [Lactobacillus delbrueckii subsp. bulgaricus]|uniref:Uncharacterized protein n=1 Tax=Lactobacillus delbrueckii TaxID=1584 RepID=A0ABD0AFC0_9LACO|nr:hypothetical protein [Lactobacillus delbrueckii]GHN33770.1 hypothetical protein ME791_09220 [Lactobacillus delbrueckii]
MRPVPSRAGDDKVFEGSIINVISDIALALAKAAESTLQGHPAGCLFLDLPLAELLALIRAFLGAIAVKPAPFCYQDAASDQLLAAFHQVFDQHPGGWQGERCRKASFFEVAQDLFIAFLSVG